MRQGAMIVLCGCTAVVPVVPVAPPPATVDARPATATIAIPGEVMEFRMQLRGVTIGTMQTAIGRPGQIDSRRAVIVRSHGRGEGLISMLADVSWELTTTLDLDTGFPIDDHEEAWVVFEGHKDHGHDGKTWRAGDETHDVHSAFGAY